MAWTSGRENWAGSFDSVNPLGLAAERNPDALGNLASMGLVVAASSLADGRNGFVALAWFDDAARRAGGMGSQNFLDRAPFRSKRPSAAG